MPFTRSQVAKMARYSDMPPELHIMFFKVVLSNLKERFSPKSKYFRKTLGSLALVNRTWRSLVQETLFKSITLRADELPDLIALIKDHPELLTYVKNLTVTAIAGDSVDVEATRKHKEAKRKEAKDNGETFHDCIHTNKVLKQMTFGERLDSLTKTWSNLEWLFSHMPQDQRCLESLHLSGNDKHDGLFNRAVIPQYNFVPQRLTDLTAFKFPIITSKKLILEPVVLEHIELNPSLIKSIVDHDPDVEHLELKINGCRYYRPFRKALYNILTETMTSLAASHNNLTTLIVNYPSSTGEWNGESYDSIYPLADPKTRSDPLSLALCHISQQLVKFHYSGRISIKLFGDGKEGCAWPKLKDFFVEFENVDAFGNVVVGIEDHGHDGGFECEDCGEAIADAIFEMDDFSLRAVVEASGASKPDFEEGFDFICCERCRYGHSCEASPKQDKVDELFGAASSAMTLMPLIEKWQFQSSSQAVFFSFNREANTARVRCFRWQPNPNHIEIWKERFPKLRKIVSRDEYEYHIYEDSDLPMPDGYKDSDDSDSDLDSS